MLMEIDQNYLMKEIIWNLFWTNWLMPQKEIILLNCLSLNLNTKMSNNKFKTEDKHSISLEASSKLSKIHLILHKLHKLQILQPWNQLFKKPKRLKLKSKKKLKLKINNLKMLQTKSNQMKPLSIKIKQKILKLIKKLKNLKSKKIN